MTVTQTSQAAPFALPVFSFQDIDQALVALDSFLPELLTAVGAVYPPAAAVAKFLPLVHIAIRGVNTIALATGQDATASANAVAQHLTPGQPNASALN